jgi:hypothetical protein
MFGLAAANNAAHAQIIWRIKKRHMRAFVAHEPGEVLCFARIATEQPMLAEPPEIALACDRRRRQESGINVIRGVGDIVLEVDEQCVDFGRLKTGHRDVEPVFDQEFR